MRNAIVVSALLVCTLACGAKTGLAVRARPRPDAAVLPDAFVPDAFSPDTGHDAALDAGPICAPDVALLPAHADVVLVLDRSGSMTRALASSSTTRWDALSRAVSVALPEFDANVAFGATIFPIPEAGESTVCATAATLDVPVGLGSAPAILRALAAHPPSGGTPTANAIDVANGALSARSHVGVPQSIVLVTDGGPNCDPADAGQEWYGWAPETCESSGLATAEQCLDRARTLTAIDSALARGLPTYVIALDVTEPYLVDVLEQMAMHGGRARAGAVPYYEVRNPDDLRMAFGDIATRVASCSFFPDGTVSSDAPMVEVGGVVVAHDETHTDGWAHGPSGTFDLFGSACDLAMRGGVVVRIVGECH